MIVSIFKIRNLQFFFSKIKDNFQASKKLALFSLNFYFAEKKAIFFFAYFLLSSLVYLRPIKRFSTNSCKFQKGPIMKVAQHSLQHFRVRENYLLVREIWSGFFFVVIMTPTKNGVCSYVWGTTKNLDYKRFVGFQIDQETKLCIGELHMEKFVLTQKFPMVVFWVIYSLLSNFLECSNEPQDFYCKIMPYLSKKRRHGMIKLFTALRASIMELIHSESPFLNSYGRFLPKLSLNKPKILLQEF